MCRVLKTCLGAAVYLTSILYCTAQAPANDNFAASQIIVGVSGSVVGSNIGATAENKEPKPGGVTSQSSIWYTWTAPYSGWFDFSTLGSATTNGLSLQTVMGIYVATNSPPQPGVLAPASSTATADPGIFHLNATQGRTYYIQIDGAVSGSANAQGIIQLNWGPGIIGGNLSFAQQVFIAGGYDNEILAQSNNELAPSLRNPGGTSQPQIRLTVARNNGAVGRCQVDVSYTNGYYSNVYFTNYLITNIIAKVTMTNGTLVGYSNEIGLVIDAALYVQDDYRGTLEYLYDFGQATGYFGTNFASSALVFQNLDTNSVIQAVLNAVGGPFITNWGITDPTNFQSVPVSSLPYTSAPSVPVTNGDLIVTYQTNYYHWETRYNLAVPTAASGIDYIPGPGTLTFDDFQMSKDFYIDVPTEPSVVGDVNGLESLSSFYAIPFGPDWPDPDGNYVNPYVDRQVVLTLSSPRLDPSESTSISPPTLGQSTAELNIMDLSGNSDPNAYYLNRVAPLGIPNPATPGAEIGGYMVYNFERSTFRVNKDAGFATIYLYRIGYDGAANTVSYVVDTAQQDEHVSTLNWDLWTTLPGSDYAIPTNSLTNCDFGTPYPGALIGTVSFPAFDDRPQPITFPIQQIGAVEFDQDIYIHLILQSSDASSGNTLTRFDANEAVPTPNVNVTAPSAALGGVYDAHLTINFDNTAANIQPGGAYDRTFNRDRALGSQPPENQLPGANSTVQAVAVEPDGKSIIGGSFTAYNTFSAAGVARILADGTYDSSFNTGSGAGNGSVQAVAVDANGNVLIAGSFNSFNGHPAPHIARLTPTGAFDTSFNVGFGADSTIWAMTLDAQGRILIGGNFTNYNVVGRKHIARLLSTGALDTTFNPGAGTDEDVNTIAADGNGNVILGGAFTRVNGTNWNGVARLTSTGALDATFSPSVGANDAVFTVCAQPDNKIVIGGAFTAYAFVARNHIARLNADGSLDTSFDPGTGANDVVFASLIQPDGNLLIGGSFTSYNDTRRVGIARILPQGWVDTSFMDASYNQFAGLINHYYDTNAITVDDDQASLNSRNTCYALALQADLNVLVGGVFNRVGGGYTRDDVHYQWNYSRVIGAATPGLANGGLGNYPGNLTFASTNFSADEKAGSLFVTLQRVNGSLGPAAVTLSTNTYPPGPGSATSADFGIRNLTAATYPTVRPLDTLTEYDPATYGWRASDGEFGPSYNPSTRATQGPQVLLSVFHDAASLQDMFANMALIHANGYDLLSLGNVPIPFGPSLGLPAASLDIVNDDFPSGVFGFSATNYPVVESAGTVTVTVVRTNGSHGAVNVSYTTTTGFTNGGFASPAAPGGSSPDYVTKSGVLQFRDGVTSQSFTVTIYDHSTAQPNKFFNVVLSAPSQGGSFDTNNVFGIPSVSTVTIVDDHFQAGHLAFNAGSYTVLKGGVAAIPVIRAGGALGSISVQVVATNLASLTNPATSGQDYLGVVTNLTWNGGDIAPKTAYIQTLDDNIVEGPKVVSLYLTNAVVGNNPSDPNNASVISVPSNANLTIQDSDCPGTLSYSALNYNFSLSAGTGMVTVIRTGGTVSSLTASYAATQPTATNLAPNAAAIANVDFTPVSGTLTFNQGESAKSFGIPILPYHLTNELAGTNRLIQLTLSIQNPVAPNVTNCAGETSKSFPKTNYATLVDPRLILSPAGSVDLTTLNGSGFDSVVESLSLQTNGAILAGGDFTEFALFPFNSVGRIRSDGAPDVGFLFNKAGADGTVWSVLAVSPSSTATNNSVMIAGDFGQVNGVNRSHIARLNFDGTLDTSFNPGAGFDNTVYCIAEEFFQQQRVYLVGGSFASYNSQQASGIARVLPNGALDSTFNTGSGVTGSNAAVRCIAIQADNKILVAGDFLQFNNAAHVRLVRLNQDGSVDTAFMSGYTGTNAGPNDSVRAILVQPDGKILVGGSFTQFNAAPFSHLVRLNADGSIDTTFNVGAGTDNTVLGLALDSQARILVVGEFGRASGVTRNGITRLNTDGTVDPTVNFGLGANGFVSSVVVQTNGEIDLGGGFTTFDEIPENGFVRIYGGERIGSGTVEFDQGIYGVNQNVTNALISVRRQGGTQGAGMVTVYTTTGGTASNGVDYTAATNTLVFPPGETFQYFSVPIVQNLLPGGVVSVDIAMTNGVNTQIQGQATATLYITNVISLVGFSDASYRVVENVSGGAALIPVVRTGNVQNVFTVQASTAGGSAVPNVDYTPTNEALTFASGVMTQYFVVPVLNNPNMFVDGSVNLHLDGAVGAFVSQQAQDASLTIVSAYGGPGVFSLSQSAYSVDEGAGQALITVNRGNGTRGTVTVTLSTSDGTAKAGLNYVGVNTNITFADNEFTKTVSIPIIQLTNAAPDTTVNLALSAPSSGTIGSPSTAVLTILNNVQNFSWSSSSYFVNEGGGSITLRINRGGPTDGPATVQYITYSPTNAFETNGLAEPNLDYQPTNFTVNFASGQAFATVTIPIYQSHVVKGPAIFQVLLTNSTPAGITQIGVPGTNVVTILSDLTGFVFDTNSYSVGQNAGYAFATVDRINANTGPASIQYFTSDGTASSNFDYLATNGTLLFADGQATATIAVPIINLNTVTSSRNFSITIGNPITATGVTPTNSLQPTNALVTITNVLAGVSFSSLSYSVSKCGVQAMIPVIRSGLTNTTVQVGFSTTTGGSALPGTHYVPTNGTLTFGPGVTTQYVNVTVIDDNVPGPDRTVNLLLSGAVGAKLLNPNSAQLVILECHGAFVVPAGTAFVTPGVQPVLAPNEIVTIRFALRDISQALAASNLVAVLQQTNGIVTNGVSGVVWSNSYGTLAPNGPAAWRPFTFKVTGTNGQAITAILNLQYGTNTSAALFGFLIGGSTSSYSNPGSISIPTQADIPSPASGPANPYPSTINVSNVVGLLNSVSVTVSNFSHSNAADVDLLLQQTGGATSVLMAHAGYGQNESHVTLTFDQTGAGSVPFSSPYSSGAYAPTYYSNAPLGTIPTLPSLGSGPFTADLTAFVGSSPVGSWNLYAYDDRSADYGSIAGGWTLNLSVGSVVPQNADLEVSLSSQPLIATTNNVLIYTLSVTNYGPAGATNVVISDYLPPTFLYLSNNFAGLVNTNGPITFSVPTLGISNGVSIALAAVPTALGYATNLVTAIADQPSVNANNSVSNVVLVGVPSADLGITLASSINPVFIGNALNYIVTVTNNGPSTANGTVVYHTLPPGFVLVGATTPAGTTLATNSNPIIWTIGQLNAGQSVTNVLTVRPMIPGLPLDTVSVSSAVYDPAKFNNFASVKTEVDAVNILFGASSTNLNWAGAGNYVLVGETNQSYTSSSAFWVTLTPPGVTSYNITRTNIYHFFRLKTSAP